MRPTSELDMQSLLMRIDQARRLTRAAALLGVAAALAQHPLLGLAALIGGLHALAKLIALGWWGLR